MGLVGKAFRVGGFLAKAAIVVGVGGFVGGYAVASSGQPSLPPAGGANADNPQGCDAGDLIPGSAQPLVRIDDRGAVPFTDAGTVNEALAAAAEAAENPEKPFVRPEGYVEVPRGQDCWED